MKVKSLAFLALSLELFFPANLIAEGDPQKSVEGEYLEISGYEKSVDGTFISLHYDKRRKILTMEIEKDTLEEEGCLTLIDKNLDKRPEIVKIGCTTKTTKTYSEERGKLSKKVLEKAAPLFRRYFSLAQESETNRLYEFEKN